MSFSPEDVEESIQKVLPDFSMEYHADFRQAIAETWPKRLDDTMARRDWGWNPQYDLDSMTRDMLSVLKANMDR
jgi:nucleoside-diphosphate-sugar epimerase